MIEFSYELPQVLQAPNGNSGSMVRALKQINHLLLLLPELEENEEDMLNHSLEDLQMMFDALNYKWDTQTCDFPKSINQLNRRN